MIDVIIVNWNAGEGLRACVRAVSESEQKGYRFGRVVVVDNSSGDHSADGLACANVTLVVIKNDKNRGFAAACNQGASGSTARYLLFLNPDTKILPNTLTNSVEWMEDPGHSQTGVLGVQLLDQNGQVTSTCAKFLATRYFVNKMLGLNAILPKLFPDHLYAGREHLESLQVDHVMGAYFFVRNRVFKELNGFDERFFVYYEDVDLSLRMREAGWSSYYLTTAQCYHAGCGTSNQAKAYRLFYSLESRIFYAFKHFSLVNALALLMATVFIEPIPRFGQAVTKGSWAQIREVAHGYFLFWRALPGILKRPYLREDQVLSPTLDATERR